VNTRWRSGKRVRVLENGDAYFPPGFNALRAARHDILIQTFIVFEDKVGLELRATLIEAAQRGVEVDSTAKRDAARRGRSEPESMEGAHGD
jgi:cardiolipin synthase